jgi:predicted ATPase/DNA-binding SARP family transcriptional activator
VGLEFRILGPIEVHQGDRARRLGGPKQRALLAALLLARGEVVPIERLIEDVWAGERSGSAARSVQVYVSELRKVLGDSRRIRSEAGGYRVGLAPGELDAERFERLLEEGSRLLADWKARAGLRRLDAALALWRGPALQDVAYETFAQREISRLEELRVAALENRLEAQLALGGHREVLADVEALVAEHPLRERLRCQLMLALYRSGRQADALEAYQSARRTLVEELGIEPGRELKDLEASILRQDSSLHVRPAEARARRLPAPATSLVGRRQEVQDVVSLLGDGSRLVTLTGPGGTGKTRVAIQAAHELTEGFEDGVAFVGLAALRDPELVLDEMAGALGVEVGAASAFDAVAESLRDRDVLLVVDNFEQVDAAAPLLSDLLSAAEQLKLLVTSRHRLRLYGEHDYAIPPLRLDEEAVPLFVARAHDAGVELEPDKDVRDLCRALDSLPLAIELAAGRVRELPPSRMLETLPRRLELAVAGPRDVPDRQRTLTAAISWSYELLGDGERRLFEDLAVFSGGWDGEAASTVCNVGADELAALVSRSLIALQDGRYTMLATIREFAAARLDETSRANDVAKRHATHFLKLAEQADGALEAGDDTVEWLDRLEAEHDNLRVAFDRAADALDGELGLRLAVTLGRFWEWRSHVREGLDRLESALLHAGSAPVGLRARATMRAGVFAQYRGELGRARERIEEALALARSIGDESLEANALRNLGALAKDEGEHARAQALHEEARAISARHGDRLGVSSSLINLSDVALSQRDYGRAETLAKEGVLLARELGHEVRELAALLNLGLASLHRGRDEQARATLLEAVRLSNALRYPECLVVSLEGLAALDAEQGDPLRAARLMGAADALLETAGYVLESGEQELHERTLAAILAHLDREEFENAWREGHTLSFEAAAAEAQDATSRQIRSVR